MKIRRALAIFALAALPAAAQTPAGAIAGHATDESGGALPGVNVEVAGPALRSARVGVTDVSGAYRLDGLASGTYTVSFKLINFVGVVRQSVEVREGQTATADAKLRLSASADVVVTAKRTFRNLADVTEPGESLVGIADASTQGVVVAE